MEGGVDAQSRGGILGGLGGGGSGILVEGPLTLEARSGTGLEASLVVMMLGVRGPACLEM